MTMLDTRTSTGSPTKTTGTVPSGHQASPTRSHSQKHSSHDSAQPDLQRSHDNTQSPYRHSQPHAEGSMPSPQNKTRTDEQKSTETPLSRPLHDPSTESKITSLSSRTASTEPLSSRMGSSRFSSLEGGVEREKERSKITSDGEGVELAVDRQLDVNKTSVSRTESLGGRPDGIVLEGRGSYSPDSGQKQKEQDDTQGPLDDGNEDMIETNGVDGSSKWKQNGNGRDGVPEDEADGGERHLEDPHSGADEDGRDEENDRANSRSRSDSEQDSEQDDEEEEDDDGDDGDDDDDDDDEDDDEDEDEDEEDDDDDDDDAESIDVSDSPIFISQRGPLGISDLILPPSAVSFDSAVRVKSEPGAADGSNTGQSPSKIRSNNEDRMDVDVEMEAGHAERIDGSTRSRSNSAERGRKRSASGTLQSGLGTAPADGSSVVSNALSVPLEGSAATIIADGLTVAQQTTTLVAGTGVDGEQVTNVLVAKPKRKWKRRSPSVEIPKPPPKEILTIRINVEIDATKMNATKIYSFKDESVAQGSVPPDYWLPQDLGPKDVISDDEDGDSPKNPKKARRLETGGSAGASSTATTNAPAPTSSLSMLLNGNGPEDDEDLRKLAAALDARHEDPPKKRGRKKKTIAEEDYDVNDPFIDDTDLMIDEPTFYRRPVKEGFYVQKGAIELMGDAEEIPGISPKKRQKAQGNADTDSTEPVKKLSTYKRSKMLPQSLGMGNRKQLTASSSAGGGISPKQADHVHSANATESVVADREGSPEIQVTGVKNVVPPRRELPKSIEEALAILPHELHEPLLQVKAISDKHDWSNKARFPEILRQPMLRLGQIAIDIDKFDDDLFDAVPMAIKYNRLTMHKWLHRELDHYQSEKSLKQEDDLIELMRIEVEKVKANVVEEYEVRMNAWKATQDMGATENQAQSDGDIMDVDVPTTTTIGSKPWKKWRWTPGARSVFYRLVVNVEKRVAFNNILHEHNPARRERLNEQSARTEMYKRIVPLFPDGFITTTLLSREMSAAKKRERID